MENFLKICFCCVVFSFVQLFSFHLENKEIFSMAKRGENVKRVDVDKFFHPTTLSFINEKVVTDPLILQSAAKLALKYFQENKNINPAVVRPSIFGQKIVSSKKVEDTLKFIISTIEQDKNKKIGFRILNSDFITKNFKFIKWEGDLESAKKNNVLVQQDCLNWVNIPKGKIRLTKYAIFTFDGSYKKTNKFCCPMYQITNKKFAEKDRFNYTKQNILNGILTNSQFYGKVKSIVWLTKENLDDAMMQGTALVKMPDGKKRLFTVDMSNGFPYDKKIKDLKLQKRYWYFREVKGMKNLKGSILDQGGSVFAGDVFNIGIGKIIAIKYLNPSTRKKEIRLGVLNDVGGAFANNLYQLDLFAGVFKNKDDFRKWIRGVPDAVDAYIMVKV